MFSIFFLFQSTFCFPLCLPHTYVCVHPGPLGACPALGAAALGVQRLSHRFLHEIVLVRRHLSLGESQVATSRDLQKRVVESVDPAVPHTGGFAPPPPNGLGEPSNQRCIAISKVPRALGLLPPWDSLRRHLRSVGHPLQLSNDGIADLVLLEPLRRQRRKPAGGSLNNFMQRAFS
jgi:hypothetical protein